MVNDVYINDGTICLNHCYRDLSESIIDIDQLYKDLNKIDHDLNNFYSDNRDIHRMDYSTLVRNMMSEDDPDVYRYAEEFNKRIRCMLSDIKKSCYNLYQETVNQLNNLDNDYDLHFKQLSNLKLNPFCGTPNGSKFSKNTCIIEGMLVNELHELPDPSFGVSVILDSLREFVNENIMLYLTYENDNRSRYDRQFDRYYKDDDPMENRESDEHFEDVRSRNKREFTFALAEDIWVYFEKISTFFFNISANICDEKKYDLKIYWALDKYDKRNIIIDLRESDKTDKSIKQGE
ncbi:MAG: hypothetical protein K2N99_02060, partial [Malacoplasma sp.]|nr:hypothetical protein [Malacoplasma sp.]